MNIGGLTEREHALICDALATFPHVEQAILYGSRAKGVHRPSSDIDLALTGVENELEAQTVSEALDALPLPYKFDVNALHLVRHTPLLAHIEQFGVPLYQRAKAQT